MRLFLFDIDGTLIYAHQAGRTCLLRAMQEVFGTAGAAGQYDWRGKTDPQIVRDLLRGAGVPESVIEVRLDECFATYAAHLEKTIDGGHPVDVYPGIREILETLSHRTDSLVGLLTGNVEAGARLKLKPTGLLPYFKVAAYGSDDSDRRKLPAVARARAQALLGRPIPFSRLVIIGDTPLDIDCARAAGARAVAVATGHHPLDELAAHSPDLLFKDFARAAEALHALTSL
jgi:phosphoglycolate phosphatase-like HAD superfamily hydrolase